MTHEYILPTASQLVPQSFSVSNEVSVEYGITFNEPDYEPLSESSGIIRKLELVQGTKYILDCLIEIGTVEFKTS